jgi:hypothetical protein|tara:strand:+ start:1017 stop:1166 length:150 start_codon:yes stop_codon:yes gene_type:complete
MISFINNDMQKRIIKRVISGGIINKVNLKKENETYNKAIKILKRFGIKM